MLIIEVIDEEENEVDINYIFVNFDGFDVVEI